MMAAMDKVNLAEKLALFSDYWNRKVVGELNGQQVKLVKFKGPSRGTITTPRTRCFSS
jgi:hypothetical protein